MGYNQPWVTYTFNKQISNNDNIDVKPHNANVEDEETKEGAIDDHWGGGDFGGGNFEEGSSGAGCGGF